MKKGVTYKKKLEIIEDNAGGRHQDIAERNHVSRSLVTRLLNPEMRSKVLEQAGNSAAEQRRCRIQHAKWPELERELMDWIGEKRELGCVISGNVIKRKAFEIRDRMASDAVPEYAGCISRFKASNGWFDLFKKRACLHFRSIFGQENNIPASLVDSGRARLKDALSNYAVSDIYNLDETGLFYRQRAGRSFLQGMNRRREVVKDKQRVTILLCCSLTGEKMKPVFIGKSQRPRALRNCDLTSLPCSYHFNKNSWLTRAIFQEWLGNLNEEMVRVSRNIAIVLDNFSGHSVDRSLSNIELIFLPPGTTSLLQPLDCGIIRSFKAKYTNLCSDSMLLLTEARRENLNIKEAMSFVIKAWNEVSEQTIINCWARANIVNPSIDDLAELASAFHHE